ncbi:glycosyltransferase family 2 protein [Sulfitobacter sp. S190]|uniref:glycosyltransferase family 2 protein n=1 Tax=Sulfitobacter sp. S190 TaxID=2867022 RepID=UPI0021A2E398|nr:glycosyltransferase family 2 protein [Sulfitobacter sp. S190]
MTPRSFFSRVARRLAERRRRARFAAALEHIHGADFHVPRDAVLAIVLVRDGSYYMDAFFDYYRAMGVTHFAFFDNGSTDDTLARIRAEPNTVIDRAVLPLAQYEDLMRGYPAQTYGADRWCLYVDMDEQFDFEGRARIGIDGLVGYLRARGDTALVAQMLEMFPVTPLRAADDLDFEQALAAFDHYDISTVERRPYHAPEIPFAALLRDNTIPDARIDFCFGGVRGRVFGETCCLTKHPLIFNGPGVTPAPHPHLSQGVVCSDMTAVIRHYKFAGGGLARDIASSGTADLDHGEDAARARVAARDPDVTLYSAAARRWAGIAPLQQAGFLVPSAGYNAYLASREGGA